MNNYSNDIQFVPVNKDLIYLIVCLTLALHSLNAIHIFICRIFCPECHFVNYVWNLRNK